MSAVNIFHLLCYNHAARNKNKIKKIHFINFSQQSGNRTELLCKQYAVYSVEI